MKRSSMQSDLNDLRVGLVVPSFDKGGLESVVFAIYNALRDRGYKATLFVERGYGGYFSNLVDPSDIVNLREQEIQLFAEIAARRINIMHYHYSLFMIAGVQSVGIPTIYSLHNVYTWLSDAEFSARASLIKDCDCAVAVSSFCAHYFRTRSGRSMDNLMVLPNGISVERLLALPPFERDQYGIPAGTYVFAQFSSFHRVKHHMLLIRAAEILKTRGHDFRVVFFGNIGDRLYYREIGDAVARSSARDRILLPGFLAIEEVGAALRGIVDCAILTTLQEGCGNSALEAAALHIPLIMTNTGIAEDLLEAGVDIDLVPTASRPEDLTYARIEALSREGDTDNLQAVVAAMEARLLGVQTKAAPVAFEFDQSQMTSRYIELYQSIVRFA